MMQAMRITPNDAAAADTALCPPPGVRIYAIGDVHGHLALLERMIAAIDADLAAHPVKEAIEVTLGDYIDRGPDSRGVLQLLATRPPTGRTRVSLRGNHEDFLLDFLDDPTELHFWAQNGAVETLASYGVHINPAAIDVAHAHRELTAALPEHHRTFLKNLSTMHRIGDIVCAHAGIRPGVPLDEQSEHDLTTIRRDFIDFADPLPVRVVHGHTPVKEPEVTPYRIDVDTGAFATGQLTCAVLEGPDLRFLTARYD